jgi:CubicO group peptidase (beta-lactamase class C family)
MSHDILAAVMEIATGKKYEDLAKELIFSPLKMENTTFLPNEADFESMCEHYEYDPQKECAVLRDKNAPYRYGTLHASGGAGCVSTAEDYIKFGEALRKCELVSQDTLKLMTTNQLTDNQWNAYIIKPYGYGLGLRCPKTTDDGILDFGWDGAASSYFAIIPQLEATFFVAQHIINSPKQEMRHGITQYIVEELKKL